MKGIISVILLIITFCSFAQEKKSSFTKVFLNYGKEKPNRLRFYCGFHNDFIKQINIIGIDAGMSVFSTKKTAWHFEGTISPINNSGYIFIPKVGVVVFIGKKGTKNVKGYFNILTGFAIGYVRLGQVNEIIDGANINSRLGVLLFSNSFISMDFFTGHNLLTLNNTHGQPYLINIYKNYIQLGCRVYFL